jgi:hypothetical protein
MPPYTVSMVAIWVGDNGATHSSTNSESIVSVVTQFENYFRAVGDTESHCHCAKRQNNPVDIPSNAP